MSNNSTDFSAVHILELSNYEAPKIVESKKDSWVGFGESNDYYNFLIERYTNSPTNNAVINNIVRLIYGKGLTATNASRKPSDYARMIQLLGKELQKQNILDAKLLGQFAIQIIYSKDRKSIAQAEHMPIHLIRPEKCNKEGEIEAVWYSDNWSDIKTYPPKRIPLFQTSNEPLEILWVKPYSVGMKYFAYPDYQGAIPYMVLEEEISNYLINEVQNGFSGTKVVNFNNGIPSEEQRDEISNTTINKLTGTKGKRVIVAFNMEEKYKTTVEDIPLNDAPSHYEYLAEECMRKIMLGHNVTSPLLFGIASSNGFSSNADELQNSFVLYYNMVIKPYQELIIEAYEKILAFNGINLNLEFITLKPLEFGNTDQVQNQSLSKIKKPKPELVSSLGHDLPTDWVLIDEYDVDYSRELELDSEIESLNNPKLSKIDKIKAYLKEVSRGTARPNAKSVDDEWVDGVRFFSRYKYTGPSDDNTREFCSKVVKSDKLYRKEDILQMNKLEVNPGWGPNGDDIYDIFLYKGGGNCRHIWKRQVYVSLSKYGGLDMNNPNLEERHRVAIEQAMNQGYVVKNDNRVETRPVDMPNNGFLPTNKRFN